MQDNKTVLDCPNNKLDSLESYGFEEEDALIAECVRYLKEMFKEETEVTQ